VIVEIGLCTGLLLLSQYFTDRFFGLTRSEQEAILARSQELTARRKEAAAAEEQLAAEQEKAAAEARAVAAFLDKEELAARLSSDAERLTPESFLHRLPPRKLSRLRREIKTGVPASLETKAYLVLAHRQVGKKGGRHDA